MNDAVITPARIRLDKANNQLRLEYHNTIPKMFTLTAEFLRVYSPSAEVRGHGEGASVLQTGKKHVHLTDAILMGNYAIKLVFDDGHASGLYTWPYLYKLCLHQADFWQDYLEQLHRAGASRDPDESIIKLIE